MKLKDTFMSSTIYIKILKYQCIPKNFPLLCRQFFQFITLKKTIFFGQLQLANNFFYEKSNPLIKIMVCPLKCFVLKKRSLLFPDSLREEFCVPEFSMACHKNFEIGC